MSYPLIGAVSFDLLCFKKKFAGIRKWLRAGMDGQPAGSVLQARFGCRNVLLAGMGARRA